MLDQDIPVVTPLHGFFPVCAHFARHSGVVSSVLGLSILSSVCSLRVYFLINLSCDIGLAFHLQAPPPSNIHDCVVLLFFAQILAIWTLGGCRDR